MQVINHHSQYTVIQNAIEARPVTSVLSDPRGSSCAIMLHHAVTLGGEATDYRLGLGEQFNIGRAAQTTNGTDALLLWDFGIIDLGFLVIFFVAYATNLPQERSGDGGSSRYDHSTQQHGWLLNWRQFAKTMGLQRGLKHDPRLATAL